MPIARVHSQELISLAYIRAVAASGGFLCGKFEPDYGFDLQIQDVVALDNENMPNGPTLQIQAKSECNATIVDGILHHNLEVKNYKKLSKPLGFPSILVVYCMPEDDADWLKVDDTMVTLKHCGYWLSLKGFPDIENQHTKVVHIPVTNIFDADALRKIMQNVVKGKDL